MRTENARRRVSPLAPDDRRAALIEATLPLLREHGLAVNTRQIADAAGVAEGTIFRAFPDKNSLIVATAIHATDAERGRRALAAIDPGADLRTRVLEATSVLRLGREHFGQIHLVIRQLMTNPDTAEALGAHLHGNRAVITQALIDLFTPDAGRLRVSPATAARFTLSMIFMTSFHGFEDEETMTAEELVAVLLDGMLRPPTGK